MKKSNKKIEMNRGMSYVELIVVLSIFSIMSSVVIFNYGDFQAKVDIKNLASDIALKVVEAQKSSLSGKLPPSAQYNLIVSPSTWKPSFGVYLSMNDPKSFIYFANVLNPTDNLYETPPDCTQECLDKITITKNNSISGLDVFYLGDTDPHSLSDLTITFTRPNSGAIIKSTSSFTSTISYVRITIVAKSSTATIRIYPSGRIQVN